MNVVFDHFLILTINVHVCLIVPIQLTNFLVKSVSVHVSLNKKLYTQIGEQIYKHSNVSGLIALWNGNIMFSALQRF